MLLYPNPHYTYDDSVTLEVNLEKLASFYKVLLLKAYVKTKPVNYYEHDTLINLTGDLIHNFKDDIEKFRELIDVEIKRLWIEKIKAEETAILEKSILIVEKLSLP